MKFYIFFSVITYLILSGMLFRNIIIINTEYSFSFYFINSIYFYILLTIKLVIDILLFVLKKQRDVILKTGWSFFVIIVIVWFAFFPKLKKNINPANYVIKQILEINKDLFRYYNLKKKTLPDDETINNIIKTHSKTITPYLKNGEQYNYVIKQINSNEPVLSNENFAPGTIIIVVDKQNNNYYITAFVLNLKTQKTELLTVNNNPVIVDVNLNIQNILTQMEESKNMLENVYNK